MVSMKDAEHVFVYKDPDLAHACNQVSLVALQKGEVFMGFNEERYPVHADSGQSCFIKSKDGGKRAGIYPPNRLFGLIPNSRGIGIVLLTKCLMEPS